MHDDSTINCGQYSEPETEKLYLAQITKAIDLGMPEAAIILMKDFANQLSFKLAPGKQDSKAITAMYSILEKFDDMCLWYGGKGITGQECDGEKIDHHQNPRWAMEAAFNEVVEKIKEKKD